MRPIPFLLPLLLAGAAAATEAPLVAAAGKGAAQPSGDPTPWLALAAVAMIAALILAQRLVSRRPGTPR
jgi:hypothetical protein